MILTLAILILLFFIVRQRAPASWDWRQSYLMAVALWAGALAVGTEILSTLHGLHTFGVTAFWGTILIVLLALLFLPAFKAVAIKPFDRVSLTSSEYILFALIAVILVVLGITAYWAPPNTWDSMAYHMARVSHWIQNHTVEHFPTHDQRQLWKSPWAEYAIMHLYLLSGSDQWSNFVQWFSCTSSIIAVSLIGKGIGLSRLNQWITALIALTLPQGILEATSTQNDYASSFWILCLVCFGLAWLKSPGWPNILGLSASLGLALMTKEINYIFAFAVGLWLLWQAPKKPLKHLVILAGCALAAVMLFNGPHHWRNLNLYHHPLSAPDIRSSFINDAHDIRSLVSNVLLNIGSQSAIPYKPFNQAVEQTVTQLHRWMGLTIEQSPANMDQFRMSFDPLHEDHGGNLWHLLMIAGAVIGLCCSSAVRTAFPWPYAVLVLGMGLTYIWFMKWGPFNNRLHIPLFLLFCPLITAVWSAWSPRSLRPILIISLAACLPWLLSNYSRPLTGFHAVWSKPRDMQYFRNWEGSYFAYNETAKDIAAHKCTDVGFALGEDSWEYPLWVMLKKHAPLRLERIMGDNISFQKLHYPLGTFTPCAIVTRADTGLDMITYNGQPYIRSLHTAFLNTYIFLPWYLQQHPDVYQKIMGQFPKT